MVPRTRAKLLRPARPASPAPALAPQLAFAGTAPAVHPRPRQALAAPDPVSGLGFLFLLIFVYTSSSRVLDFFLSYLHLPLILAALAGVLTLLLGRGLTTALSTRVGKLVSLFAVWMVICVPFSEWRGGSFYMLRDTFSKSFLVFLMVAASASRIVRVRRMMITIVLGTLTTLGLALVLNFRLEGRLALPDGYLSNPNDMAQVLLVGLCFLPTLFESRSAWIWAVVTLVGLVYVYAIFATGSRGALLTVLLLAGFVLYEAAPLQKVLLLVAFLGMGLAMFMVSSNARARVSALFSGQDTTSIEQSAQASSDSRAALLKQSLLLTIRNPLFGVGPGVFQTSAADVSHEAGERAQWKETHNSYTQVSSETGIPGLLFFGGAVLACLAGLIRARKLTRAPQYHSVHRRINCLLMGVLSFALTSLFSSVAYQLYFFLMLGLGAAAITAVEQELAAAPAPDASTPSPGPARPFPQPSIAQRAVPQRAVPPRIRG